MIAEWNKQNQLVIFMVGLPGRRKTLIASKIVRYLNWLGYSSSQVSTAKYRKAAAQNQADPNQFDPNSEIIMMFREEWALQALAEGVKLLQEKDKILIFDGNNLDQQRRHTLLNKLRESIPDWQVLWLEVIWNDTSLLTYQTSISQYVTESSVINKEELVSSFLEKIELYNQIYETIDDNIDQPWIKMFDFGKHCKLLNISGYLQTKIATFVLNLDFQPRTIFLLRHGETQNDVTHKIGGDSELTNQGQKYWRCLNGFFQSEYTGSQNVRRKVMISTKKQCKQAVDIIGLQANIKAYKQLDDIQFGDYDEMTFEELQSQLNIDSDLRSMPSLDFRFPWGESYCDVLNRLETIILELENVRKQVVIVGHLVVLRCIYSYFIEIPKEKLPFVNIPNNQIIKIEA